MQVSFRKVFLGSLIAATFAMPAAAEIKVGVVDIAKLFEESPQAKVVQDGLKAEFGPRLQQLIAQEKLKVIKWEQDRGEMAKSRFVNNGPKELAGRNAKARGGRE